MQAMRIYDEPALTARLALLDHRAKIAFSAACAQRLMPLFARYAEKTGAAAHAQRLAHILLVAWQAASDGPVDVRGLDSEAASFCPSDDAEWVFEMGYAQYDLMVVESVPPSWDGLRHQSASEGLSWAATLR